MTTLAISDKSKVKSQAVFRPISCTLAARDLNPMIYWWSNGMLRLLCCAVKLIYLEMTQLPLKKKSSIKKGGKQAITTILAILPHPIGIHNCGAKRKHFYLQINLKENDIRTIYGRRQQSYYSVTVGGLNRTGKMS